MKRTFVFILVLNLVFALTSCKNKIKYYKLTLPEHITSDVSDVNKVEDGSTVVLTINIPDGYELEELRANGSLLIVSNNYALFHIASNTEVTVSFKLIE